MYSTALLDGRDRFLDDRTRLKMMIWDRDSNVEKNSTPARCMKITEKVAFSIASEPSYVYILSGQKLIKNAKNGTLAKFWKPKGFSQTVLPDTSVLKSGKNRGKYQNAKIQMRYFLVIFKKSKKQNKTCRTAIAKLCRGQKCKNVMSPFVLPYLFSYFSQCEVTLRKSLRCIQYSFAQKKSGFMPLRNFTKSIWIWIMKTKGEGGGGLFIVGQL